MAFSRRANEGAYPGRKHSPLFVKSYYPKDLVMKDKLAFFAFAGTRLNRILAQRVEVYRKLRRSSRQKCQIRAVLNNIMKSESCMCGQQAFGE